MLSATKQFQQLFWHTLRTATHGESGSTFSLSPVSVMIQQNVMFCVCIFCIVLMDTPIGKQDSRSLPKFQWCTHRLSCLPSCEADNASKITPLKKNASVVLQI